MNTKKRKDQAIPENRCSAPATQPQKTPAAGWGTQGGHQEKFLKKIGAVLTYRHLGRSGVYGQQVGVNGAGSFCVVVLGNPFDAERTAREYAAKLCRCGARICDICIVTNHETYLDSPISIVEVDE